MCGLPDNARKGGNSDSASQEDRWSIGLPVKNKGTTWPSAGRRMPNGTLRAAAWPAISLLLTDALKTQPFGIC